MVTTNKDSRPESKLADEIKIVRMLIRQAEKKADEGNDLADVLKVLETISRASANLAALLKAERALEETRSSGEYVRAALEEIKADMQKKGIDSILTSGLD
jgi:Rad3-related DNA helicase